MSKLMKGTRLLLLTSYCFDESEGCTEEMPCKTCINLSNVVVLNEDVNCDLLGGLQYLKEKEKPPQKQETQK